LRCEWSPIKIKTKGIRYLEGAAFPSGVNPIFSNCMYGTIKLDNALAHHANRIQSYVCEDLGGTLNYGLPANPKSRNFVEYVFRRLNELSHRQSATTGSNPASKIRETSINSKSPPPVKLHEFEEMLEVVLAGHNNTPQVRLKGSTPLEVLQHQIEKLPIPICYSNLHREKNPFIDQDIVDVINLKNEQRAPYVNFAGHRYRSSAFSNINLLDKQVLIKFDKRDIRTLKVFDENGCELGEAYIPNTHMRVPLSLRTNRKIQANNRKNKKNPMMSVDDYFSELIHSKNPKDIREAIRVYREIKDDGSLDESKTNSTSISKIKELQSHSKVVIPDYRQLIRSK